MTTITIDRATVEQALEALEQAHIIGGQAACDTAITALRAELAQQAEPVASRGWLFRRNADGTIGIFAPPPKPGESQRTSDCVGPNNRDLHELLGKLADHMAALAQQAEPVQEPVYLEVCCDAHPKWMRVDEQQFDEYVANGWKGRRLYTAPPQRKPLPKQDQHCVDVPGYGLVSVRLVRAVERAHGITDPQIEDHLARHGIPMPDQPLPDDHDGNPSF